MERRFARQEDWRREVDRLRSHAGTAAVPRMLEARPGIIVTEFPPDLSPSQVRRELRDRRDARLPPPVSGIILAGGKSRRMGRDKASLELWGKTFLQHQVDKLQMLGVDEILLSGADVTPPPGTVVVPDRFTGRGPLGGIHACLAAARHPTCLVLTVDTPLVPVSALVQIRRSHHEGITVLSHGDKIEPLISVIDRAAVTAIEPLIAHGGASVRALKGYIPWNCWEYVGPEQYLANCNTPQEYRELMAFARDCRMFASML